MTEKHPPAGYQVELVRDLTRYHPALRRGARGLTKPPVGRSSIGTDQFCRVAVETGEETVEIDIRWFDLRVIDARWVAWFEDERKKLEEALRTSVREAVLWTGPHGGFQELEVSYTGGRPTDRWRLLRECEWIVKDLEARGLLERKLRRPLPTKGPPSWPTNGG